MTDYNAYFAFDNRDTYLVARAKWRADYAALSAEITKLKNEVKDLYRANDWSAYRVHLRRVQLSQEATDMLDARHEMKVKSAEQRLADQAVAA